MVKKEQHNKRQDRVRVYRNLNKKCLSVQSWVAGKGWRVTDHVQQIFLDNASFKVSQAGRRRVLDQQRKNVHAFIIGDRVEQPKKTPTEPVKYNPYVSSSFFYVAKPMRHPIKVTSAEVTPNMVKVSSIIA
jgi:hypothetical protein